jgi:phosphoribosyl 1,2-cyclic phosphodiesterase
MQLHIINSNSAGNGYILEANNGEAILIECGVRFQKIKEALDFRLDRVAGALVTHKHGDHCISINDVLDKGIKVYATFKEHDAMGTRNHHNAMCVVKKHPFNVGSFEVIAFEVKHDTPDPVGYLIRHAECGTVLFLTDTVYSPYTFDGLNNIIVEANYCEKILAARLDAGEEPEKVRDRVITSHMSIDNCIDLLHANDLSAVNNIVLIHLSNRNSHAKQFHQRVEQATGKQVTIADAGVSINFDLTPY